ncbi:hypothetical protein A2U01_0077171 [Trifolium medium]|uniref:Uncharacterized protein n=1 Tax=Trifolium medium TaxID=97028 RepID=A0A392T6Z7_9FABA|nr:hypothetical protein [Trifolium medium]
MAPETQTAGETATAEITKTEDEDGIHQIRVQATTEVVETTPPKTTEEGNPTVIQDGPPSL